jgi:hypothetical protein
MPLRLTHRNLAATLKTIDRRQPANSPLIQVPRKPHANAGRAIFGNRPLDVRQYRQLVDWVMQVGEEPDDTPSAMAGHGKHPTGERTRRPAGAQQPADDPFDPDRFNRNTVQN